MLSRWELLHLPVRLGGRERPWGFVEDLEVDWSRRQVTALVVRAGWRLFRLPAGPDLRLHPRGVEVARTDLPEAVGGRWWRRRRAQGWGLRPHPVYDSRDRYLGRVTDYRLREDTGAVVELVVSRGILSDLWSGLLVVPVSRVRERIRGSGGITVDLAGDTGGETPSRTGGQPS